MRGQNYSFEILCKKKWKRSEKSPNMCETRRKKTKKEFKMYEFLVCACKSPGFAQSQKNFALSRDHDIVTFRNSGKNLISVQ